MSQQAELEETRRSGSPSVSLGRARACYERRMWSDAFDLLAALDIQQPLDVDDLERLGWSAALIGNDEGMVAAFDRLYAALVTANECSRAAMVAFWAGYRLLFTPETARANGWLARAQRLAEREPEGAAVRGWLMLPALRRHFMNRDFDRAADTAAQACEIGERQRDADLTTVARGLHGRALLCGGEVERGLSLVDEAMLSATSGELSPVVTGLVYCMAIDSCDRVFAVERSREWTSALGRFCDAQPQLVTFSGACRLHRAEVLTLGGEWVDAIREARTVCERDRQPQMDIAEAHYRQGEIHRLQGDHVVADENYRRASQLGRDPQPGLSLLRLSQGQSAAAAQAMRRALGSAQSLIDRVRLLPAYVEVMIAEGALDDARAACDELARTANTFSSDAITALVEHARGSLALASKDAAGALSSLRTAFRSWTGLGAPYLAARVRVSIASACRALGDEESAALELSAARDIFVKLGAAPDVELVDALHAPSKSAATTGNHGLSARELEVLRLVATGATNKAIASELSLSEKTVDRHVSNIFTKLDVNTRAAATAFAYEQKLV